MIYIVCVKIYYMVNDEKAVVITVDKSLEIKEINRITNEIFLLIDKFMVDDKTSEDDKIKDFTNLFIEIHNICVVDQDQGKYQLIELKIELNAKFQKKIKYFKDEKPLTLRKNKLKSSSFIIVINVLLEESFKEMIKNIKNSEKRMLIEEFIKKHSNKSRNILKTEINKEMNKK